ncbi:MAG: hypothetical protein HOP07_14930 [Bacteriovoracaceae bacterium]|nr:hypothetical protein [Bacteriovoracaceae bacterium]
MYQNNRTLEKNLIDLRNGPKTIPANKLSEFERQKIIKIATSEKYRDKSPWEIVPMLADSEGIFIGSESSFYRVLKKKSYWPTEEKVKGEQWIASTFNCKGPNEIWSWILPI